ncbi:MAG: hypothetical protein D6706_13045, partial [Chloroflexi bacterium]
MRYMSVVILLLVGYSSLLAQPLSGDYTIGGSNPDFATISDAVNALLTDGVAGPVNLNIRPGTYEEN